MYDRYLENTVIVENEVNTILFTCLRVSSEGEGVGLSLCENGEDYGSKQLKSTVQTHGKIKFRQRLANPCTLLHHVLTAVEGQPNPTPPALASDPQACRLQLDHLQHRP